MAANIHPFSYDSESKTSPQQLLGYHGTACAGIIGSLRNNIVNSNYVGIAGVAPNCKIMSISNSLAGSVLSREARADGIDKARINGADVISNSWSWTPTAPLQIVSDAISNAVSLGRGGKGCIVVFSSGNNTASSVNFPGNLSNVIAVGNITRIGSRDNTSNYGDALNVTAPGTNSYSTDWQGGYANFGGTSAACPHVAGIAALILSINPNLTTQQVQNIIESTAQELPNYPPNNPARPNWNNQVGYGLVNAYAAIQEAICLLPVNFTNQIVIADTTVTSCGNINVQNVKVQNGAKLTLDAGGEVNIISDFEVESGSEFEIVYP